MPRSPALACAKCGYDLAGLPLERRLLCPECGRDRPHIPNIQIIPVPVAATVISMMIWPIAAFLCCVFSRSPLMWQQSMLCMPSAWFLACGITAISLIAIWRNRRSQYESWLLPAFFSVGIGATNAIGAAGVSFLHEMVIGIDC